MKCKFCNATIYVKVVKHAKSVLAPRTEAEALRQRLEDMTGESYVILPINFCPMCGRPKEKGVLQ